MTDFQPESGSPESTPKQPVTQTGDPYETRGQTRLATRHGYEFAPSNKDLPKITPAGVNLTADEAREVQEEADSAQEGLVYKVTDEEG